MVFTEPPPPELATIVEPPPPDLPPEARGRIVIGYTLFERIYYLLVAGYDVFGNVGHQLNSRLYMDFMRMEGEFNFLVLLPQGIRQTTAESWYQGAPDDFLGPNDAVPLPSEADQIDFEGEFGVITDAVPMGTSPAEAMKHIKLIVQINDWSLRTLAGPEMKTGFGWVQAKPPCSMAPYACTPDELGDQWRNGRACLDLLVDWNGERFGAANGEPMGYGFHELVAHAARTRNLVAGTVIGSGTVSNENYREIGSSCIAERRGIEIVDEGAPRTEFMRFGDIVWMQGTMADGRAPFGVIEQKVVSRFA